MTKFFRERALIIVVLTKTTKPIKIKRKNPIVLARIEERSAHFSQESIPIPDPYPGAQLWQRKPA